MNMHIVEKPEGNKPTIGFISGCLDLPLSELRPLLKAAKDECDMLFVAINTDPRNFLCQGGLGPQLTVKERIVNVMEVLDNPNILTYETEEDLMELLQRHKPAIRFLSNDYDPKIHRGLKRFTGDQLPSRLHFLPFSCWHTASKVLKQEALAA